MEQTILIIDDDEKLNRLLRDYLTGLGFKFLSATTPSDGMRQMHREQPDLIILDVMLPEMNGFDACRQIRKESSIPVLMLTARGEVMDRIVGLELGADDYLAKPFEPRELVARIQSILRRAVNKQLEEVFNHGGLKINFSRRRVTLNETNIELTTTEFAALTLLVKNEGKVLNRDQILDGLKGMDCDAFNRTVDITMSRVRNKLNDDPKNPKFIKTIWGTGYVFIGGPEKEALSK